MFISTRSAGFGQQLLAQHFKQLNTLPVLAFLKGPSEVRQVWEVLGPPASALGLPWPRQALASVLTAPHRSPHRFSLRSRLEQMIQILTACQGPGGSAGSAFRYAPLCPRPRPFREALWLSTTRVPPSQALRLLWETRSSDPSNLLRERLLRCGLAGCTSLPDSDMEFYSARSKEMSGYCASRMDDAWLHSVSQGAQGCFQSLQIVGSQCWSVLV